MQAWLDQAQPLVEYLISHALAQHNVETREGKLAASHEVISVLAGIENAVSGMNTFGTQPANYRYIRIHCAPM